MNSGDEAVDVDGTTLIIDLPDWVYWTYIAFTIALRILAIFIVPRDRRPQTAAAWLLAIMFIP